MSERRTWWTALTGLLATSPYWLDPRWLCDESGGLSPNWELIGSDELV
jgi:hypothetical protein